MSTPADRLSNIPFLGSGLGFRRELKEHIFEAKDRIDFLEIITDQYVESPQRITELEEACKLFPVIPHGIGLSVGSAIPLNRDYLRAVKEVVDTVDSPYYSEHLCMTRAPGIDIGHLSPLWFTEEVLKIAIDNVLFVQDFLGRPLVLENVTYHFAIPQASMSQPEFFWHLVEATGCGILLDVTNVFINSTNHGFDPEGFLDQMPLDRVVQLHLAGGFWKDGVLIDGHCEQVQEETWDLLARLTRKTRSVRGSILEHDKNFPEDFALLLQTVERTREIMNWPLARAAA